MMLTHSTTDKIHYELRLHGTKVADVVRFGNGFILTEGEDAPAPQSMRALKEQVYKSLPDEMKTTLEKITVDDAIKMCGMSHTAKYVYTREIKRMWPEWTPDKYGPYMVRKHNEAVASWGGISGWIAQDWLDKNTGVGVYDKAEEERRIVALEP